MNLFLLAENIYNYKVVFSPKVIKVCTELVKYSFIIRPITYFIGFEKYFFSQLYSFFWTVALKHKLVYYSK